MTDFNPMSPSDHLLVFDVVRREDASGTSGTGIVAKGVVFPSGTTVVEWQTHVRSVVVYNSYADALHIHGHKDLTGFCFQARPDRLYLSSGEWVWLAEQPPPAEEVRILDSDGLLVREVLLNPGSQFTTVSEPMPTPPAPEDYDAYLPDDDM